VPFVSLNLNINQELLDVCSLKHYAIKEEFCTLPFHHQYLRSHQIGRNVLDLIMIKNFSTSVSLEAKIF